MTPTVIAAILWHTCKDEDDDSLWYVTEDDMLHPLDGPAAFAELNRIIDAYRG